MAFLLREEIVRFESFCETLNIYCCLRDWKELPCPNLEHWLRSNILPLDARFSKLLDPFPRPQTILDDSSVQAWFERAKDLDPSYCSELKAIILRRSLGIRVGSPLPGLIRVEFDTVSEAMSMPCEVLKRWLEENSNPTVGRPAPLEERVQLEMV